MDKIFNFRDEEFRNYFIDNINIVTFALIKDKISDRDLLRFYFLYSKLCDKNIIIGIELIKTLFNYKMKKISDERINNFKEIVKSKTGVSILFKSYNAIKHAIKNDEVFNELVNIFLDEI